MKRHSHHRELFCGLTAMLATLGAHPAAAADPADIKATMKHNFESLMNLQPFVASQDAFADPKNHDEIAKNLEAMTGLSHVFPQKMAEQEPGLVAIANLFNGYLKDTQSAFKAGAKGSYVRNEIRTMTGYCLSCHTRVGVPQGFADAEKRVEQASLTDFQRAEFYAATRQFDRALAAYGKILMSTPSGELGYIEFSRAVRSALAVSIRAKQDPKATLEMLGKIKGRDDVPEFFRRYVDQWVKDATQWAADKKRPADLTPSELMAQARKLVAAAAKAQLFQVDPAGDVSNLRATNVLHEALSRDPKGKFRGEALYLLGQCYDSLQDPLLWAVDSLYFEACVRENPHTDISKKCYRRYASKLYFGYSGSGGTFVPEDELKKLAELRKISE